MQYNSALHYRTFLLITHQGIISVQLHCPFLEEENTVIPPFFSFYCEMHSIYLILCTSTALFGNSDHRFLQFRFKSTMYCIHCSYMSDSSCELLRKIKGCRFYTLHKASTKVNSHSRSVAGANALFADHQ